MKLTSVSSDVQVEKLAKLAFEIWHEYWPCILSSEQIDYMVEKFQSYSAIKNQIENENYHYYFLEYEKEIVGYVGVSVKDDYLFLSKLYIKKEMRGKGCGKFAFKEVTKIAEQFNKNKIVLTVNKNNTNTIKAYEKWNFQIIDSVVSDIGNGFVMDDFIMEYKL